MAADSTGHSLLDKDAFLHPRFDSTKFLMILSLVNFFFNGCVLMLSHGSAMRDFQQREPVLRQLLCTSSFYVVFKHSAH